VKHDIVLRSQSASAASLGGPLSAQFLEQARARLGLMAGLVAGLLVVGLSIRVVTTVTATVADVSWAGQAWVGNVILLAASIGLWRYSRSARPEEVIRVGAVYQVLGAGCISIVQFWGDHALQEQFNRMTWLGPWILLFPLVVPARPRRNLVTGLVCASWPALVFVVWCAAHHMPLPPFGTWLGTFLPYYLCAGLATVPASLIYGLGEEVSSAQREVRRLGSYRLVSKLGAGGMGEVWRAEHSLLARPAAIKLIKGGGQTEASASDQESSLARFEREAKTTAALRSPHTIGLYDFGVTASGDLYYAMELLQGIDLDQLVQRFGPVSPSRAVAILIQACESLAEAHDAGLVHRDIKPANLFLCRLGRTCDFVKVLDFGLVTQGDRIQPGPDLRNLTGTDFIVGTPAFMAPEQAQAKQLDGRADIYALGCVGFWLLTGSFPFDSGSAMGMLLCHIREPARSLSAVAEQPIPPALEELITRCMAKDPAGRPQDAMALAHQLAACDAREPWKQDDAQRWWDLHGDDLEAKVSGSLAQAPTMDLPEGAQAQSDMLEAG
jgi:eukaryotic-like serine/threonine-protein kinase